MFLRIAVVAPLALATILPAQLKPQAPVAEAPTETQAPVEQSPEEKLAGLKKQKARLAREIAYASKRVEAANKLMSSKLRRAEPSFESIDAGKPVSAVPVAPKPVQRRFARIGTAEEMNIGGNTAMVTVNGRGISQANFDRVMNYLREAPNGQAGTDAIRGQRVLFDMIQIEGIASQFIENEGEVKLSESLAKLESGELAFDAAVKQYGSVQGSKEGEAIWVTRNSTQGPQFESIAFSTPVGKIARPFRNAQGYVVLKAEKLEKGAQPQLDKVLVHAVQFAYSPDKAEMQRARYQVNSGQVDVLARDQAVLDMLPALFKPAPPRKSAQEMMKAQMVNVEKMLEEALESGDDERVAALKKQLEAMRQRMEASPATERPTPRLSPYIEKGKSDASKVEAGGKNIIEDAQKKIDASKKKFDEAKKAAAEAKNKIKAGVKPEGGK